MFENIKLRNKLLGVYAIVLIAFISTLIFSYNTMVDIDNDLIEVSNKADLRATSYALSLNFEEQVAYVNGYTAGILPSGVTQTPHAYYKNAFITNIGEINANMDRLIALTEGDENATKILNEIQAARPAWIQTARDDVMSIPQIPTLAGIRYSIVFLEQSIGHMLAQGYQYMITGDPLDEQHIEENFGNHTERLQALDNLISTTQEINQNIYDDFNGIYNDYENSFTTWYDNVINFTLNNPNADITTIETFGATL
ncbi:MAG: hypothetical protein OEZ01_09840, partial [Candidatus Heimdallarchaeota archaeon]|nr:hypothetical protein [Candidatus Heimdallarchaeota archaeon]